MKRERESPGEGRALHSRFVIVNCLCFGRRVNFHLLSIGLVGFFDLFGADLNQLMEMDLIVIEITINVMKILRSGC